MLKLTPLEDEALSTLSLVKEFLTRGKTIGQQEFTELMGKVRDTIQHLENKSYGCLSGIHFGTCSCTESKPGVSLIHKYKKPLVILLLILLSGCDKRHPMLSIKPEPSTGPITIVVGGQSNADSGEPWESVISETGKVSLMYHPHTEPFVPTLADPARQMIAWMFLGDKLYGHTMKESIFYGTSAGGTSSKQWVQDGVLDNMIRVIKERKPCAVLWVQGESDWLQRFHQADSYGFLKIIIDEVHKVDPDILFMIAITGDAEGTYDTPVIKAQMQLIQEGYAVQGGDLQELRRTGGGDGGFHLTLEGKERLAEQFLEALMRYKPWE